MSLNQIMHEDLMMIKRLRLARRKRGRKMVSDESRLKIKKTQVLKFADTPFEGIVIVQILTLL